MAARDRLQPQLTYIWAENAEEYENEKALQGVEDCKQNLEGEGSLADGEGPQNPGETKEDHNSQQTDCQTNGGFPLLLVTDSFAQLVPGVPDENHNDYDVHDEVKQKDGKYRSKKGSKEDPHITNEATVEIHTVVLLWNTLNFLNLQLVCVCVSDH